MANEFSQLPNPTNVPEEVSSGYQRQNTNMFAIQTGLDTTAPYDNGSGVITIPAGGVVEVNGVLFKLTANVTLNKSNQNTCYWIAITGNGNGTASASLVTRPGAWRHDKLGCYRTDGKRTLNWISLGTLASLTESTVFSQNVKGRWEIQLPKGWYYIYLASGKGGGNGGNASGINAGAGGVASLSKTLQFPFFHDGKKLGGDPESMMDRGTRNDNEDKK
jgi:hypothetical protein